jgi:exonuclease III
MLTIIGNNCAGLKAKLFSFRNLVNVQKPAVVIVQETKLYRKGTIQLENFCIFEKLREKYDLIGKISLSQKLPPWWNKDSVTQILTNL